jgi:hypothetical protein
MVGKGSGRIKEEAGPFALAAVAAPLSLEPLPDPKRPTRAQALATKGYSSFPSYWQYCNQRPLTRTEIFILHLHSRDYKP